MPNEPTQFDPGPWLELSNSKLIRVIQVLNFEGFLEFVSRIGSNNTDDQYVWRGQRRSEWFLQSTLGRADGAGLKDVHFNRFVHAIARCSNVKFDPQDQENKAENAAKIWSLGQHYGLKTPLIDFTVYPFFALFFAFVEPDPDYQGMRSVHAMDAWHIPHLNAAITHTHGIEPFKEKLYNPPYDIAFQQELQDHFSGIHSDFVMMVQRGQLPSDLKNRIVEIQMNRERTKELRTFWSLTNENNRIHGQGGCHIYTQDNIPIEEWLQRHAAIFSTMEFIPFLTKIEIPNSERQKILSTLNKMNVNYMTAFPDFAGAALHCNLALAERHLGRIRGY